MTIGQIPGPRVSWSWSVPFPPITIETISFTRTIFGGFLHESLRSQLTRTLESFNLLERAGYIQIPKNSQGVGLRPLSSNLDHNI